MRDRVRPSEFEPPQGRLRFEVGVIIFVDEERVHLPPKTGMIVYARPYAANRIIFISRDNVGDPIRFGEGVIIQEKNQLSR
ncbi:hypothetical protein SBA_ch1_14170 [Sphingomonas bisphenolicum]|uniref:Uncharacterized protein n=1 Tax=Sphingomonas bisphenolicum TaxID=296544 RepID=A0ABM7G2L5_9SPHN|nr:hypothetical protein SBA_ch1_14170 [Sphingomonas bisphenolicum]